MFDAPPRAQTQLPSADVLDEDANDADTVVDGTVDIVGLLAC